MKRNISIQNNTKHLAFGAAINHYLKYWFLFLLRNCLVYAMKWKKIARKPVTLFSKCKVTASSCSKIFNLKMQKSSHLIVKSCHYNLYFICYFMVCSVTSWTEGFLLRSSWGFFHFCSCWNFLGLLTSHCFRFSLYIFMYIIDCI